MIKLVNNTMISFQHLSNQSESNASDWAKYRKIWKAVDKLSLARSFDAHQAFTQIDQNIQQKLHKKEKLIRLSIAVSSVAAVLLVVFGMKLFFMSSNETVITSYSIHYTKLYEELDESLSVSG